jgi:hypothetical protein
VDDLVSLLLNFLFVTDTSGANVTKLFTAVIYGFP